MPGSFTLRVSVAVLGILAVVVVAYLATAVSVFQHDVDVAITSTPPEPRTPGYLPIYAAFGDSVGAATFVSEAATQTSFYENYLVAPTCTATDELYAVAAPTSVTVLSVELDGDADWTVSDTAITIDELPYLVWTSDSRQTCATVSGLQISLAYGPVTETFDAGLLTHQATPGGASLPRRRRQGLCGTAVERANGCQSRHRRTAHHVQLRRRRRHRPAAPPRQQPERAER